ncbi:SDR family oxidoreductase [Mesorhizobium sp. B4-1-3]|uniref:SDR family oxidoreductase n=1 Tax=Mesorhizobium sp. B4-1-3 TaxID=2589889 RepID=UPI001FEE13FB|nr:SDR family oxidoreductase [Mesorhizobium sp. B4-1-3]
MPRDRASRSQCDVSQARDVKAALDKTVEAFGRLDFTFNNAGVEHGMLAVADITEEEFDGIIDTDLRGAFRCMKHEIPMRGPPSIPEGDRRGRRTALLGCRRLRRGARPGHGRRPNGPAGGPLPEGTHGNGMLVSRLASRPLARVS